MGKRLWKSVSFVFVSMSMLYNLLVDLVDPNSYVNSCVMLLLGLIYSGITFISFRVSLSPSVPSCIGLVCPFGVFVTPFGGYTLSCNHHLQNGSLTGFF